MSSVGEVSLTSTRSPLATSDLVYARSFVRTFC
jgi:hypothetical protein